MKPTGDRTRRGLIALAVAATTVSVSAIADEARPLRVDMAAQIQEGRRLYTQHCAQCHGINMVTPGTVAYDLRTFPHDAKARFINSVTHGKNNRMPAWGDMLSPRQIDLLWAYVRSGGKS